VKTVHKFETEAFPAGEPRKGNKKILCQDGNNLYVYAVTGISSALEMHKYVSRFP
jgi:hypothetical protein